MLKCTEIDADPTLPFLASADTLEILGALIDCSRRQIHFTKIGIYEVPLRITRQGHLACCITSFPFTGFPRDADSWDIDVVGDAVVPPEIAEIEEIQHVAGIRLVDALSAVSYAKFCQQDDDSHSAGIVLRETSLKDQDSHASLECFNLAADSDAESAPMARNVEELVREGRQLHQPRAPRRPDHGPLPEESRTSRPRRPSPGKSGRDQLVPDGAAHGTLPPEERGRPPALAHRRHEDEVLRDAVPHQGDVPSLVRDARGETSPSVRGRHGSSPPIRPVPAMLSPMGLGPSAGSTGRVDDLRRRRPQPTPGAQLIGLLFTLGAVLLGNNLTGPPGPQNSSSRRPPSSRPEPRAPTDVFPDQDSNYHLGRYDMSTMDSEEEYDWQDDDAAFPNDVEPPAGS